MVTVTDSTLVPSSPAPINLLNTLKSLISNPTCNLLKPCFARRWDQTVRLCDFKHKNAAGGEGSKDTKAARQGSRRSGSPRAQLSGGRGVDERFGAVVPAYICVGSGELELDIDGNERYGVWGRGLRTDAVREEGGERNDARYRAFLVEYREVEVRLKFEIGREKRTYKGGKRAHSLGN
ncbi:hypothetical protein BDZ91DRAFT_845709 [Kalaharituber pfeilii]|nr:hypothetical protein BDZ91DRAFT_845709 [Kalaharituber pfeilii]